MHTFPQTTERVARWAEQPEVLGVLLVGSRSRGHADALSDDDLEVLLSSEAHARLSPAECIDLLIAGEGETRKLIYDAQYTTLEDLQRKATSPIDLDRWPYERAKVLFDRDGSVAAAVEAAGRMDPDFRHMRLLHATIDAWIAPRRAAKTLKRGFEGASRLLVARGARAMCRLLFALDWRWVPLDHWLEAELTTLRDPEQVGPLIIQALTTGDPALITEGLDRLEERLAVEGVPRPKDRANLFFELIHPSHTEERAIHGLP
jgi:predicted nucleotidyltransferase